MFMALDRMEMEEKVFKDNFGPVDIVIWDSCAEKSSAQTSMGDWQDIRPMIPLVFLERLHF